VSTLCQLALSNTLHLDCVQRYLAKRWRGFSRAQENRYGSMAGTQYWYTQM